MKNLHDEATTVCIRVIGGGGESGKALIPKLHLYLGRTPIVATIFMNEIYFVFERTLVYINICAPQPRGLHTMLGCRYPTQQPPLPRYRHSRRQAYRQR